MHPDVSSSKKAPEKRENTLHYHSGNAMFLFFVSFLSFGCKMRHPFYKPTAKQTCVRIP